MRRGRGCKGAGGRSGGRLGQMPGGLRAQQAGVRRGENAEGGGAGGVRDARSRDAKGRDGKRQRCEGGREAKGRDVSERGAKGEVKREGYKGEGCKGRVAKRRNAKGRGGQDGDCKEERCRRAEMGKAGTLRDAGSCCQTFPGPGMSTWWHPGLFKVKVQLAGFWKCEGPSGAGGCAQLLQERKSWET